MNLQGHTPKLLSCLHPDQHLTSTPPCLQPGEGGSTQQVLTEHMKEQGDMGREAVTLASLVSSLDLSPERPHVETQRKAHPHLGTTAEASAFSLPGDLSFRHPSLPVHRQLTTPRTAAAAAPPPWKPWD